MSFTLSASEFETVVDATLAALPEPFQHFLEYTLVVVDDGPPGDLFGLYFGAPAPFNPSPRTFDTITLYKRTLELHARSEADLRSLIRKTLLHEIGHHFGLNEDEVGAASYPG
jgi:predicted Zn-dependent protease with MMP-like domain